MTTRTGLRGLQRQRGAVGLLSALFLITAVLVMGQALLRQSASGANDSLITQDGVDALFLAESGLERAAAHLASGAATCDASLAGSWSYAGGTVAIADLGAGFTADFDGSALASGYCRLRSTGTSGLYGAQRTVEGIIGTDAGNLLGPYANFDDIFCIWVLCTHWDTFWTGWPWSSSGWDHTGGTGGSRALVMEKNSGPSRLTRATLTSLSPFTVTAPTTLTVDFDYSIIAPSNHDVTIEFELAVGGAFVYSGSRNYAGNSGGFVSDSIAIPVTGSGPVTIDGFQVTLSANSGPQRSLWLDNLVMAGGGGGGGIARWREIIN